MSRQRQYGKDSSDYPQAPSPFEKDLEYKISIEETSDKGKGKRVVIGLQFGCEFMIFVKVSPTSAREEPSTHRHMLLEEEDFIKMWVITRVFILDKRTNGSLQYGQ